MHGQLLIETIFYHALIVARDEKVIPLEYIFKANAIYKYSHKGR